MARQFLIEPMKRLPGNDEIDAIVQQSCGFCGAFDACELRVPLKKLLSRLTHRGIGLDTIHSVPILQEDFTKNAGA